LGFLIHTVQFLIYKHHTIQNLYVGILIIFLRATILILKHKEGTLYSLIAPLHLHIYAQFKWKKKGQVHKNVTSTDVVNVKYYCNTPKTILTIKPTRCANFSSLFLEKKLYMFRTGFMSNVKSLVLYTQQWYMSYMLCWQLASRVPLASCQHNLYDILVYHCCVYSTRLLTMDIKPVGNIQSFISKINLRN